MFKCKSCGHIFEEGEQYEWEERHGLGTPPYEKFSGCPICHREYEEAQYCKICGEPYTHDELMNGICDECITERGKDFETVSDITLKCKVKEYVKIDSLICALLPQEEIEDILYEYLMKNETAIDKDTVLDFVNYDRSWFAEKLSKKIDEERGK